LTGTDRPDPLIESALVISFFRLSLLGLALGLASCSTLDSDKIDYKSAAKAPTLVVPPDLTQLSRDSRYAVPGGTVTASGLSGAQAGKSAPTAAAALGDVRIERAGNQRWLVVSRPADALWQPVTDFWKENGFLLTLEQANLGIMETDWAENRAKIPQDFIRNALGKVFDSLYSSGERDKFRTRLERNATGGTDIFISHRGMMENYADSQKQNTVWQPRPADPELETEFLRRLMIKLGATQEQAKATLVADATPKIARITTVNGQPLLAIDADFDRAWRRVGLSLDRTNFTVEDRDRSKGIYYVRYVEPSADKGEPGFFSKLLGSGKANAEPLKLRIAVVSQGTGVAVSVQTSAGAPDNSANAQRILKVIADDLQ
jgi:outer membrane protein assembly factor BamC